jgi:hypothetical protein
MKTLKWKAFVMVAPGLLLLSLKLHAALIYSVQAVADANSGTAGAANDNSGLLFDVTSTSASAASIVRAGTHEAIASAVASQGTLSAGARAASDDGSIIGSTASSLAAFVDTLTLLGPAGFSGPVTLSFNLVVNGGFTACGSCPAQANANSQLTVVDPTGVFAGGLSSTSFSQLFLGGLDNLATAATPLTVFLTTSIGSEISLRGNLNVFAGAAGPSSFANANFLSTAHYYVDVLTSGVSLLSASGMSYATVVPIPPALWLFGSGLLGLIGMAQRRKAA